MKAPKKSYTCGPMAIVNGACALGIDLTEDVVAAACNCNKTVGTSDLGVIRGLKQLNFKSYVMETPGFSEAHAWLLGQLTFERPTILSFEEWDHYVVAIGRLGSRVIIYDSGLRKGSTRVLSEEQLQKEWLYKAAGLYAGISMESP